MNEDILVKLASSSVREAYPNQSEPFYGPGDYGPLINSLGCETLLRVDDDDYQGDSRVILRLNDNYGLLIFGWGSCSGCDALQACGTYAEIEELRNDMIRGMRWGTASELRDYIRDRDWELEWSYHAAETKAFIAKAVDLLTGVVAAGG